MDRSKMSQGRGGKSKTPQFPSDIFALGAKSARNESGDPKRNVPIPLGAKTGPVPTSKLAQIGERKRDIARIEPSTSSILPLKKPKISSPNIGEFWDTLAIDIDPVDLVPTVIEANERDQADKVIGALCGALKLLKVQRPRPDSILWTSFMYLASLHPYLFTHDCILQGLCCILKKDVYKNKINAQAAILAANILYESHKETKRWPDVFVKLYLDDCANERVWVDSDLCQAFVENILTCVNTKPLPHDESSEENIEESVAYKKITSTANVINRYSYCQEHIESVVLETVREHLNRKQALDNMTKNFLKLLIATCGIPEIRLLVIPKLDSWLQNAKLMKGAQDLLMSVCINTTTHTQRDVEVISGLVKIRFKPKVLGGYYVSCIKELIAAHEENLSTVLKHTIYNELSASRNPNNIQVLSVMFQMEPEKTANVLAENIIELLLNRDDFHRPLRLFLREIARAAKTDLDLIQLAKGLMIRTDLPKDFEFKERLYAAITDLICMCCFLMVSLYVRGDQRIPEKVQKNVSQVQSDAVSWMHDHALRIFRPATCDYAHTLYKITFIDSTHETYFKYDMWPPDTEKQKFLQLVSEVPLLQSTICRILLIGLSKEHPMAAIDAIELVDQLVKRCAALPQNDANPMLHVDNLKLIDLLFNTSAYHHPDKIDLPVGFIPPRLAVANMYWKSWLILLIYSAHNPAVFGLYCWEQFPTLKVLIEMTITNSFTTTHINEDLQLLTLEKQSIIEFESYLAAATSKVAITEQTSLLLSQLISLDPTGPVRKPPQIIIDQLKSEVPKLHLRKLLYRSRHPDFLLDIIKRQEPSQSMSWLADLVHSSEGSLNHLPVQCLCGFLLSSSSKQDKKYEQLLKHLQDLLHEPEHSAHIAADILSYFFHRLSFPENKIQAINGLKLLLNRNKIVKKDDFDDDDEDEDEDMNPHPSQPQETDWLLNKLPKIPHFSFARSKIVVCLKQACQVENDPQLVTAYLVFIAKFGIVSADLPELTDLVKDMANLIVERSTIINAILPSQIDLSCDDSNVALDSLLTIFYSFFNKAREPGRESFVWSENQDQILIQWSTSEQCTCNILVVHAMVILLTHGPQTDKNHFHELLDVWFPLDYTRSPRAFLVDTSEEALLIPDWLKLRMIRSRVPRLVDAALRDLEPTQLLLFIQSFGIPIASMSKLLETLDRAVVIDRSTVECAVMDKAYMIQLVEVQHRRGALGGRIFANMVAERPESPSRETSTSPPLFSPDEFKPQPKKEVSEYKQVLPVQIVQLLTYNTMHLDILKKLCEELNECKIKNVITPFVKEVLQTLMKSSMSKCSALVEGMLRNIKNACMLLRMLTACCVRDVVASLSISVQNIKDNIVRVHKIQISPLLVIIDDFFKRNKRVLSKTRKGGKVQMKGELLDWLIQVEPRPINFKSTSNVEDQIANMFSKHEEQHKTYLLTLLIHHASWATLHQCVSILLTKEKLKQCNPKIVLDFLQALNFNPKFWQGRERNIPKHKENMFDDVLNLSEDQLICVLQYITNEGEMAGLDKMSSRIDLCTNMSDAIIAYLIKTRHKSPVHKRLYIEFYLRYPYIGNTYRTEENVVDSMIEYMNSGSTTLDKMSHVIITSLTHVEQPRVKIFQLENSLRKLASNHPILVLRQIPLISSSLLGLVYLESNVLKNRNYLCLFQQIIKLLELLQPHIFHKVYKESLHSIIDTYLNLFQLHGHLREVNILLPTFISFIQNYVSNDAETANNFIQSNMDMLSSLQASNPSIGVLINGITEDDAPVNEPPFVPYDMIFEQLKSDDPSLALQELDKLSSINPSVLKKVFVALLSLTTHESSFVRNLVLTLISVYLKHDPSSFSLLVPTLLKSLDSNNPEVVSSICERLPDIIVFAQESALPILSKLFSLSMWMNCNTLPSIIRCISHLNLQSGC